MKQTVAFLPGLLCDADLFTAQIAAMQAAGHRTHVADFAGEEQVSIPTMAAKLLGELPERFSLVALSMGGYVALEVLAQRLSPVTPRPSCVSCLALPAARVN